MGQFISKTTELIDRFKSEHIQQPRRSFSHDNFVQNLEEVFIKNDNASKSND